MTARTRYFVIASLLTTVVGVGAGLVAYYGFQGLAAPGAGPAELRYVPADATLVAFADVQAVMASELRREIRRVLPPRQDGPEQFERETGINVERDIDHVVASLAPPAGAVGDGPAAPAALVLARGRFDAARIESSMRQHGASIETYQGTSLLTIGDDAARAGHQLSLAFVEPGLVAVGSPRQVRTALDLRGGGDNVTANPEILNLVQSVGGDVWAVGLFDALTEHANLPPGISSRLPPITQFAASGQVNGGLRAMLRVEATDERSASEWRDVVRGILALARLQAPASPELQDLLDSVELGGTGTTIALSLAVPPGIFEWLGRHADGPAVR